MARMPLLKICCNPFLFISCISFQTVSPISHHCPELSVYIREETFLLQHEITSLEKVSTKLEQEIQEAIKIKGQYLTFFCLSPFMCRRTGGGSSGMGGELQGCTWDKASSYSLLKFFHLTSQLLDSLTVNSIVRKILDRLLMCTNEFLREFFQTDAERIRWSGEGRLTNIPFSWSSLSLFMLKKPAEFLQVTTTWHLGMNFRVSLRTGSGSTNAGLNWSKGNEILKSCK